MEECRDTARRRQERKKKNGKNKHLKIFCSPTMTITIKSRFNLLFLSLCFHGSWKHPTRSMPETDSGK